MESSLQDFIEQIKEEGVGKAQVEAQKIIANAQAEAEHLRAVARKDADSYSQQAQEDAKRFQRSAEQAIEHASRNVLLGLKNNIIEMISAVVAEQVGHHLDDTIVKELMIKSIERLKAEGGAQPLEVLLSDDDKKKLQKAVLAGLSAKSQQGIEFKPVKSIKKGFMVGVQGKHLHFDITDAGLSQMIMEYLSPRIRQVLEGKK